MIEWFDSTVLSEKPEVLYTWVFSRSPYFREIRKYNSLVEAESKICENKNLRIAKIAQTLKLGDRKNKKNEYTVCDTSTLKKFKVQNWSKLALKSK